MGIGLVLDTGIRRPGDPGYNKDETLAIKAEVEAQAGRSKK